MLHVNLAYLREALSPITAGADLDDDDIPENERIPGCDLVDDSDIAELRNLVRAHLAPYVRTWQQSVDIENLKTALQYLLSREPSLAEGIFSSVLPGFSPDEPVVVFRLLWEELFDNQSWRLPDGIAVEAVDDLNQTAHIPGRPRTAEEIAEIERAVEDEFQRKLAERRAAEARGEVWPPPRDDD